MDYEHSLDIYYQIGSAFFMDRVKSFKTRKKQFTKKMMIREIVECTKDPHYYLNNYGMVYNPKHGYIPFRMFKYQEESLNNFKDYRFNILLKSRQTGYSTLTAGYIAWMIMFNKAKEIVVVANKQDNAQGFIRKVKSFISKSPDWMVPSIESDNKKSIWLTNGSKVTAVATTGDAGRSESLSLLVIDEAAMIEATKADDLWAAAYPTLAMGGSAIIISTPKGSGGFYHKQWIAAKTKQSDFHPSIVHWTQHPLYARGLQWFCYIDEEDEDNKNCGYENFNKKFGDTCDFCGGVIKATSPWYIDTCRQLGDERKVAQELDCDFLGSGDNVIKEKYIKQAELNNRTPLTLDGFDDNVWIWEEPKPKAEYFIGADVARGDGSDYSGFHIIRLDTMEQVAEYRGKLPPDMYAEMLFNYGMRYNEATIAVEANSVGIATCLKLVDMEYENIFRSVKGQSYDRDKKKLDRALQDQNSMIPGFQTTLKNRPLLVAELEEMVRTNRVKINSTRLISEIRTFIWRNGKPEAMAGYNDDLTISMGMSLLIINTTLEDIKDSEAMVRATIGSIGSSHGLDSTQVSEMNKSFANNPYRNNPWIMETPNGSIEDLSWLTNRHDKNNRKKK